MHTFSNIISAAVLFPIAVIAFRNTSERIREYNYPVETHDVVTPDGYVIQIFRIPYSPKLKNANKTRPAVLIQHGVLCSSDFWILNGPDNALPYLMVDAGYDVWLGNQRGNTYGRNHISMSIDSTLFWDFSWNELGVIDLPAIIDYILSYTKQDGLHYVGHSQGTTVFFVLMSEIPEYNAKIKTVHMLAPIAYVKASSISMGIPIAILGQPSLLTNILQDHELLPRSDLIGFVGGTTCSVSIAQPICYLILSLFGETDPIHLNYTLIPDITEVCPAGSSTGQIIHYTQIAKSGFFRKFDHGNEKNKKLYGQSSPPNYNLKNIKAPVRIYYGLNDAVVPLSCVNILENSLPNLIDSYKIPIPKWSHFDFAFALEVKEILYDKIIKIADHFEKTGKQLKIT